MDDSETHGIWNDPLFPNQWHLYNREIHGHDINVLPVWKEGIFGTGVTVALLDFGIDYTHTDLVDQYCEEGSFDINENVKQVKIVTQERHATRCAGEIVARGNNSVCGVGVAPMAKISSIRMLASKVTSHDEAKALTYRNDVNCIYCCSWGPSDDGATMEGPDTIVLEALLHGILYGRKGLGSIFIFATGNGGRLDNCNMDGFANSPFTIAIGAITRRDLSPPYMESCSAMLTVTYSNDEASFIVTSDTNNTCALNHSGTSAAAPIAAGIYSLLLSTRPELTWRDVQALTIQSATVCSPLDQSWGKNGAGRHFSHRFSYGKMDANSLVRQAKNWKLLGPPVIIPTMTESFKDPLIPFNLSGIKGSIVVTEEMITKGMNGCNPVYDSFSLEHVTIRVNIRHERRGDLKIYLKSPSGTLTELLTTRPKDARVIPIPSAVDDQNLHFRTIRSDDQYPGNEWEFDRLFGNGMKDWMMMSIAFWGESPLGRWELQVLDMEVPEVQGQMIDWTMYLWGECKAPTSNNFVNLDAWPVDSRLFDKQKYLDYVLQVYFPEHKNNNKTISMINNPVISTNSMQSMETPSGYPHLIEGKLDASSSKAPFLSDEIYNEISSKTLLALLIVLLLLLAVVLSIGKYRKSKPVSADERSGLLRGIAAEVGENLNPDPRKNRKSNFVLLIRYFLSLFRRNSNRYSPIEDDLTHIR